jgi:hypothetical protein
MNKTGIVFVLLFTFSLFTAEVKNSNQPSKGKWDFQLKKIWEINNAGDEVLAEPGALLVSDEGTIYFHDAKHLKHYIFSAEGKYLKTFGTRGEGPGEVRDFWESELFMVKDTLIISDISKVHFFTKAGEFIKSELNYIFRRRPNNFLNKNEFIYAPIHKREMPDGVGKIAVYNLKTKKDTVLVRFKFAETGTIKVGRGEYSFDIGGLTPMMTVCYHNNKLFYGMSDTYQINISDMNGKSLNAFSRPTRGRNISAEEKRTFFKTWGEPEDVVEKIIKATPDQLSCFVRIEVHQGLIYVYRSFFGPSQKSMKIDIFSQQGNYLYCSEIKPEKNNFFYFSHLKNLIIKQHHLYTFMEDGEGEIYLAKYTIRVPENRF